MSEVVEYHWADRDNLSEGDGSSEKKETPLTVAQNEHDQQKQRKRIHFLEDAAQQESDDSIKALVLKNRPVLCSGNSFNEVYAQFAQKVESTDEQIDEFAGDFFELYQKYKIALAYPDLTADILVSDEVVERLLPQKVDLRQEVTEALQGQETVNTKEFLATIIFQEIIWNRSNQIDERLAGLGDNDQVPTEQSQRLKAALEKLGLRTQTDALEPLTVADLIELNSQLSQIPRNEVRQVVLNQFIDDVSTALGLDAVTFRSQLLFEMRQVQEVATLRQTFALLQAKGQLAEVMNDDGSLNEEVFQPYFLEASESIAVDYKVFESTIQTNEPKPELEQKSSPPRYGEIQLADIDNDPVLSRLIEVNPVFTDLISNGVVELVELSNGEPGYKFADKQNSLHGMELVLRPQTGEAVIKVDGMVAMETSVLKERELRRNFNTALARRVVFHDLKLPSSCFMPDTVDEKEIHGLNDPLQLLTRMLPESEFPKDSLLSVASNTLDRMKSTIGLELGHGYYAATNSAEVGTLMQKAGWLDEGGQLKLSVNTKLQTTYAEIKRDPSLDSSEELMAT